MKQELVCPEYIKFVFITKSLLTVNVLKLDELSIRLKLEQRNSCGISSKRKFSNEVIFLLSIKPTT